LDIPAERLPFAPPPDAKHGVKPLRLFETSSVDGERRRRPASGRPGGLFAAFVRRRWSLDVRVHVVAQSARTPASAPKFVVASAVREAARIVG
jgi:hypothetical protein